MTRDDGAQIPTPQELREGRTLENDYLGRYKGYDVWITPDRETVWTDGMDFAYPLDLSGSFQNWVARRLEPWD